MAVLPDRRVLTTARNGDVRLVDPDTGVTKVVNNLPVYNNSEDGLQTVTLDPDFETNKWVYLYYAPRTMTAPYPTTTPTGSAPNSLPAGADASYWDQWKGYNQLSRFKWDDATDKLDLATEQAIIKVEVQRGQCCHVAGDVDFDADGNLYLSTGDNTPASAPGRQRLRPEQQRPRLQPRLRLAPRRRQHQRPARQDPAHQGRRRRLLHGPGRQPLPARHGQDPSRDLRDGPAQPVPHRRRPGDQLRLVGRLRPRRRRGRPAARPDGLRRVADHGHQQADQRRLALLPRPQRQLQRVELRDGDARSVVRLQRRSAEQLDVEHRPRPGAAGHRADALLRRQQHPPAVARADRLRARRAARARWADPSTTSTRPTRRRRSSRRTGTARRSSPSSRRTTSRSSTCSGPTDRSTTSPTSCPTPPSRPTASRSPTARSTSSSARTARSTSSTTATASSGRTPTRASTASTTRRATRRRRPGSRPPRSAAAPRR